MLKLKVFDEPEPVVTEIAVGLDPPNAVDSPV